MQFQGDRVVFSDVVTMSGKSLVQFPISEQFQSNIRAVPVRLFFSSLFYWISEQLQCNFGAIESFSQILLQLEGNLSFNFQFQSNIRAIPVQFQSNCFFFFLCSIRFPVSEQFQCSSRAIESIITDQPIPEMIK